MYYLILLVFLLTACGGNSDDPQSSIIKDHIGSWVAECTEIEANNVWVITEYQFSDTTAQQVNNYFTDASCSITHDRVELASPITVEIDYKIINTIVTDNNIVVDLYGFVFHQPPPATEILEAQYGLFVENDVLYFVLESLEGVYTIFYDYPLVKKEI